MARVTLPSAPPKYSAGDQERLRGQVTAAMNNAQGKDEAYEPARLVLKDTVTGTRYIVSIASGALTLTATTL